MLLQKIQVQFPEPTLLVSQHVSAAPFWPLQERKVWESVADITICRLVVHVNPQRETERLMQDMHRQVHSHSALETAPRSLSPVVLPGPSLRPGSSSVSSHMNSAPCSDMARSCYLRHASSLGELFGKSHTCSFLHLQKFTSEKAKM